jgi:hypothetical protein
VQPNLPHADLTAIGLKGIATILDWANALATSGVDEHAVKELTDAAAEAFHLELERAASLLCAPQPSGPKQ